MALSLDPQQTRQLNLGGVLSDPTIQQRIALISQRTGVPVSLINAQLMKESSGNPKAVGDGGKSIGIGQFYDPTWKKLQEQNPNLTDRNDPMQSLDAYEMLWTQNLQASGGDMRKALRMYNGSGPMAEKYADSLSQYLPGTQMATYPPQEGEPSPQGERMAGSMQRVDGEDRHPLERMSDAAIEAEIWNTINEPPQQADPYGAFLSGMAGAKHTPYAGGLQSLADMFGGGSQMAQQMAIEDLNRKDQFQRLRMVAMGDALDRRTKAAEREAAAQYKIDQAQATADYRRSQQEATADHRSQQQQNWDATYAQDIRQQALENQADAAELATENKKMPSWLPPEYKDATDYYKQADKIGDTYRKEVGDFEEGARYFTTVRELVNKRGNDWDSWTVPEVQIAVKSIEKMLDPGSTVRGSEAAAYEEGASAVQKFNKWMSSNITGGSKMPGEQVKAIVDALNRVYKASLPQAKALREGFIKRGKQRSVIQMEEGAGPGNPSPYMSRNDAFTIYDWHDPMSFGDKQLDTSKGTPFTRSAP